jgi:hypothetical protein
MPPWFRDWFEQHYNDLLRRVTRCARGDVEIAQEALAHVIVEMAALWSNCAFDQEGGEWHVTYHGHRRTFREFLVWRACRRAIDVYRQQAGGAQHFAEGEAEAVPERSGQTEIPAACRQIAETLAALRPCLDQLTDNYRAALVDAMIEDGDIPSECEDLAYQIVPRANLDAWRAARSRQQVLQTRFRARQRLRACLLQSGLGDLLR